MNTKLNKEKKKFNPECITEIFSELDNFKVLVKKKDKEIHHLKNTIEQKQNEYNEMLCQKDYEIKQIRLECGDGCINKAEVFEEIKNARETLKGMKAEILKLCTKQGIIDKCNEGDINEESRNKYFYQSEALTELKSLNEEIKDRKNDIMRLSGVSLSTENPHEIILELKNMIAEKEKRIEELKEERKEEQRLIPKSKVQIISEINNMKKLIKNKDEELEKIIAEKNEAIMDLVDEVKKLKKSQTGELISEKKLIKRNSKEYKQSTDEISELKLLLQEKQREIKRLNELITGNSNYLEEIDIEDNLSAIELTEEQRDLLDRKSVV